MNTSRFLKSLSFLGTGCLPVILGCMLPGFALTAGPQDFLPPAPPWHGASEALVARADDPWITPSEKTGLTDTPSYDETIAYITRLATMSPLIVKQEFGKTAQGRALYVVIASKEAAFQSGSQRAGGKPTLLAQAGIHAGEIDGKDAGLMLLRDMAVGKKSDLLERA